MSQNDWYSSWCCNTDTVTDDSYCSCYSSSDIAWKMKSL